MPKVENKCTNCADRKHCRDAQGVVTWKHCGNFRPDIALVQKLSRYEEARQALRLNYVTREPEPEPEPELRPKKGDPVEMVNETGNVLRRFETVREAAEYTGISRGRIYRRCNNPDEAPFMLEEGRVTFRWAPERAARKERAYGNPFF